jgi:SEC-C motif
MSDVPPITTRAEAEERVRADLGPQIAACERFAQFSWEVIGTEPWTGRPITEDVAERLIAAEMSRGFKSYRGVIDAALGGYGPQGAMVDRSLFEGMAVAHWVKLNPTLAAERFRKHTKHSTAMWNKRLGAHGQETVEIEISEVEAKEHNKLFGPWGDKLWVGLPMHKVISEIEVDWDEGEPREELRFMFAIAHADNTETMHATAMSLTSAVIEHNDALQAEAGPSIFQVDRALLGALWPWAHTLGMAAEYFELDSADRVRDEFLKARASFLSLSDELLASAGRNDPCPCGSGKKFKKCHG